MLTLNEIATAIEAAGITTGDQLSKILKVLRLESDKAELTRQGANAQTKLGSVITEIETQKQAIDAELRELAGEPGGK